MSRRLSVLIGEVDTDLKKLDVDVVESKSDVMEKEVI